MREIKFRAWLTNGNGITYSNGNHMEYDVTIQNGKYASVESGWDIQGLYDYPLMQYTGLKDKNGKEIYEGDIVEHRGVGYTVVWNDGASNIGEHNDKWGDQLGWYLNRETNVEGCYDEWLDMSSDMIYEVIGNIYENSEITTGLDK